MLKRFNFTLINKVEGHTDDNGEWIEGKDQLIKTFFGDLQPYSKNKLLKDYGFEIDCTNRIFIDSNDCDIKINSTVICNDITYKVVKIPWNDKHMEIVVKENE